MPTVAPLLSFLLLLLGVHVCLSALFCFIGLVCSGCKMRFQPRNYVGTLFHALPRCTHHVPTSSGFSFRFVALPPPPLFLSVTHTLSLTFVSPFFLTLPLSSAPSSIEHAPSISQRRVAVGRVWEREKKERKKRRRDHFASGLKSFSSLHIDQAILNPAVVPFVACKAHHRRSPCLASCSLANPRPSTLIQLGTVITCSTPFLCRPGSACGPAPPSPPRPACLASSASVLYF
ncbi:hypothetical protein LZ32DRAFT_447296 [Colletotrichum eremochloae]|nr:hypothetical protein LZ32DRAFT_447296 [Colletotrichum eremochloae]